MDSPALSVVPGVRRSGLTPKPRTGHRAFSILELLTVLSIMIVLMTMVSVNLGGKGAIDVTKTAYDVSGALELARTYAMANNTYVWVGFFEENALGSTGQSGTGRVVISVVASKDGTKIYSDSTANPPALPAARLIQVSKLVRLESVHLDSVGSQDIARPDLVATNPQAYQVGESAFAERAGVANGTTFPYPLGSTPAYTFSKIIQFNPQGDASKIVDTPTQFMEIGLRPARGSSADANSKNLVAIQVAGIGGQVRVYRP